MKRIKNFQFYYKGQHLIKKYYADFVCYDKIIIELKAIDTLVPEHISQVLNYLKATEMRLGILANFGEHRIPFQTNSLIILVQISVLISAN